MHLESPQVRDSEVVATAGRRGARERYSRPGPGGRFGRGRRPGDHAFAVRVAVGAAIVLGVWLRFWTPSAMWLDEALTVNIARAPLGRIPGLLRQDGAPPLYYFLLHFWMLIFGESNLGARSLAGVIGVVNLPVAWLAGYRIGSRWWSLDSATIHERAEREQVGRVTAWAVTLLLASSPFAVYYDTEARMYGLMILLGTVAVISVTGLLRRPVPLRAVGLAAVTSALLYSHYWAMYTIIVAGLLTAFSAWRGPYCRAARYGLAGLAIGCLSFAPWLPTFLFQARHTGTPWAPPSQLTAVVSAITQFAGGPSGPGRALTVLFFFLGLLAVFGAPLDRWRVALDLRSRPGIRLLAAVVLLTVVVGIIGGRLSGSAFADRYTSALAFPALAVVAYGLTSLTDRKVRDGFLAVAVALGFLAAIPNAFIARTQAGQVGAAIAARAAPADVVAYCPDQLGPAVSRVLDGRPREVTFPRGTPPEIVNWVDYLRVVNRASPAKFVHRIIQLAGSSGTIWYVWAPGYVGFGSKCQAIASLLQRWPGHSRTLIVAAKPTDTPFEIYEGDTLDRFSPR